MGFGEWCSLNSNKRNKNKSILYIIITLSFIYFLQLINLYSLPSQINIFEGGKKHINLLLPFTITDLESKNKIVKIQNEERELGFKTKNKYSLQSTKRGKTSIDIKLLGLFPVKTMEVNIVNRVKLMPGGQLV